MVGVENIMDGYQSSCASGKCVCLFLNMVYFINIRGLKSSVNASRVP